MPKRSDFRYPDEWGVLFPQIGDSVLKTFSDLGHRQSFLHNEAIVCYRPSLKRYLAEAGPRFAGFRWLAQYGKRMKISYPQPEYDSTYQGRCFEISSIMAIDINAGFDALCYAEGLGLTPVKGEIHAWNLRQGKVWDGTWEAKPFVQYFGVAFTPEFLRFMGFVVGRYDAFLHPEVFSTCASYLDNYAKYGNDGKGWRMPKAQKPPALSHTR